MTHLGHGSTKRERPRRAFDATKDNSKGDWTSENPLSQAGVSIADDGVKENLGFG